MHLYSYAFSYIYVVTCLEADSNRMKMLCNGNYFCYQGYSGKDHLQSNCAYKSWTVMHRRMRILLDYVCCTAWNQIKAI